MFTLLILWRGFLGSGRVLCTDHNWFSNSKTLLIGGFDLDRARGETLLREFDFLLSTLEGCSPREGVVAILSTRILSLAITAFSELWNVLNFSYNCLPFALTSSSPTLFMRHTWGDNPKPHWASLISPFWYSGRCCMSTFLYCCAFILNKLYLYLILAGVYIQLWRLHQYISWAKVSDK